jgi:tRNA threonylcarbamoyladenosine biosynthesis protein TsaB
MASMSTLAIATSGPNGGLALQSAEGEICHTSIAAGRGRGRDVMPALRGLLAEAGLEPAGLHHLVVDVGPGSFTGVRVGVTVAKSLAWALGLEVTAVSSLDLLASCAPASARALTVRDAGRGTVYYRTPDGASGRSPGEAITHLARDVTVVGEEASALAERFGWNGTPLDVTPGAEALLAFAREQGGTRVAPHDLAPLYLQASAPERKAAGEVD